MAKTSHFQWKVPQPVGLLSYADMTLKRKEKQGSWSCILLGDPRLRSETASQKEGKKIYIKSLTP